MIFSKFDFLVLITYFLPDKRHDFNFKYLRTVALQRYKRIVRRLTPGAKKYNRFIILTAPRSGSTLLHTYLNSSLNIYSLGEQPWRDLEQGIDREYFLPHPWFIKAVGFKVFYQFAVEAPYQKLYDQLIGEHHLKVIHLTRMNKLEQYVSQIQAWRKREWTSTKGSKPQEAIDLDLEAFEQYRLDQENLTTRCINDFGQHSCLTVSYESLVDEPEETLNEIQRYLEVPEKKLFSLLEKQSQYPLETLLRHPGEVQSRYPQYFSGTS